MIGGRTRARTWDPLIKRRLICEQNQWLFRQIHVRTYVEPTIGFPRVGMAYKPTLSGLCRLHTRKRTPNDAAATSPPKPPADFATTMLCRSIAERRLQPRNGGMKS